MPKQGTQKQQLGVTALTGTSLYQLTYRRSSKACCTSRKASASRLLMSSFRYRAIKGIVFSSLKRRIKFAHTHGSTFVISDRACQKKNKKPNKDKQTFKRDHRLLQTASHSMFKPSSRLLCWSPGTTVLPKAECQASHASSHHTQYFRKTCSNQCFQKLVTTEKKCSEECL